jgi:AcrR family transcriptional regulator
MASIRLLGGPASRERVVAEVARPAGVGRVTLYGHFPSREELMDAVLAHAIREANTVLDAEAVHHGPASDALSRLIRSSWRIVDRHRSLLAATHRDLPAARIRQHHDQVMARVERLIAAARTKATSAPTCPPLAGGDLRQPDTWRRRGGGRRSPRPARAPGVLATAVLPPSADQSR